MLADARQVEHDALLILEPHLLLGRAAHVRVGQCALGGSCEVVLPVRAPLKVQRLPESCETGCATGWCSEGPAFVRCS